MNGEDHERTSGRVAFILSIGKRDEFALFKCVFPRKGFQKEKRVATNPNPNPNPNPNLNPHPNLTLTLTLILILTLTLN
jgi:hypothetical protein